MFCIKKTYNIATHTGTCPEDCEYGHWNNSGTGMRFGVGCGAECLKTGGTLYVVKNEDVYCDGCYEIERFEWE